MTNRDTVVSYLLRGASGLWGLRGEPTDNHWHLVCAGPGADFDVHVTFTGGWVFFQAPLLKTAAHPRCRAGLAHYLLRASDEMLLAKFSLDDRGQVLLAAEWPKESFDFAAFRALSEAFVEYLGQHATEVRVLSQDARLAGFAEGGLPEPEDEPQVVLR